MGFRIRGMGLGSGCLGRCGAGVGRGGEGRGGDWMGGFLGFGIGNGREWIIEL